MLSCLRISFAKPLGGGVECSSFCVPTYMPAYTSTLRHRYGRKNRLRLWHTSESESSTCLRVIWTDDAVEVVTGSAGKCDIISCKSSFGRAGSPWRFALLSKLNGLGSQTMRFDSVIFVYHLWLSHFQLSWGCARWLDPDSRRTMRSCKWVRVTVDGNLENSANCTHLS